MLKRLLFIFAVMFPSFSALAQAGGDATLTLGDPAPPMKATDWIKGDPITSFESGHVYVVEFWATWCGPCIKSIPHLTELQERYKDKNVHVIGMASSERNGRERLVSFVKGKGDAMNYRVAYDPDREMGKSYMLAAGQGSIPTAFIVDQSGRIAWIGNPMGGLDEALARVVAGTLDLQASAAAREKTKRERELMARAQPTINEMKRAWSDGDKARALDLMERVIEIDHDFFGGLAVQKTMILLTDPDVQDVPKGVEYATHVVGKVIQDNPSRLVEMSAFLLEDERVPVRHYPLAWAAAKRAVELTDGEDPMALDALAMAHACQGELAEAIGLEEKAIELTQDERVRLEMALTLRKFRETLAEEEARGQTQDEPGVEPAGSPD